MKICPQCQTTYTDDNLKFCLQDGAPLAAQSVSQNWSESETLVSPKSYDRTQVDWQNPTTPNWTDSEPTKVVVEPRKSNTGLIIALTALITLLLIGGGVAGYLFYRSKGKVETVQNGNTNPVNNAVSNAANGNRKLNANADLVAPSPTATPTAKPTLSPKETEAVKSDVRAALNNWANNTENRDIDAHLDAYADTVDYYKAGKVSSARVRADREKAFAMYDNLQVNLSNIKITPDGTGEKAVVVLDKEWNFQNDAKSNNGEVQQQLTFTKIGGKWLITGEKDLKVYYVDK